MNDHLFGKELFILFTVVIFCVCPSFPFGIEGGMWDVNVLIPDHCLSIYFIHFPGLNWALCQSPVNNIMFRKSHLLSGTELGDFSP